VFGLNPKKSDLKQYIKNSYDVKVPEYWDKIENADISKVPQIIEKKKGRILPFYRVAAVVACLALIVTTSVIGLPHLFGGGLDQSNIVYGQDTPVRIGQLGTMNASFEKPYTFNEAYEEANLVAEIIITEWLGELDQEGLGQTTYFKAVIIDEYKNNLNFKEKEIVLLQYGNSKWTYKGYPLFKNGDRLLLALLWVDPVEYSAFCIEGEDCFAIVGSQLTEMQVIQKDGKKYALKRNLYQNFTDIENLMKPDSAEIIEDVLKQDEVLSQAGTVFECVYSIDDLKIHMDNLRKSEGND